MKINEYKQMMSYLTRPAERPAKGIQEVAFNERTRELKKDGDIISDDLNTDKTPESEFQRVGEFMENLEKKESSDQRRGASSIKKDTRVPLKNVDLTELLKEIDQRLKKINELNQPKKRYEVGPLAPTYNPSEGIGSIEAPNEITLDAIRELKKSLNKTKF